MDFSPKLIGWTFECLNGSLKGQMDLSVPFLTKSKVTTQYLSLVFLGLAIVENSSEVF